MNFSKKHVKKYYYSIREVDEGIKLRNEVVNADSLQKFKKLYLSRESSRDV